MRVGSKGQEKPAILDSNDNIRDLSSVVKDIAHDTLGDATLEKIKNLDLDHLADNF